MSESILAYDHSFGDSQKAKERFILANAKRELFTLARLCWSFLFHLSSVIFSGSGLFWRGKFYGRSGSALDDGAIPGARSGR